MGVHGKRGISDLVNVKTFGVGNGRRPFSSKDRCGRVRARGRGERRQLLKKTSGADLNV